MTPERVEIVTAHRAEAIAVWRGRAARGSRLVRAACEARIERLRNEDDERIYSGMVASWAAQVRFADLTRVLGDRFHVLGRAA